MTSASTLVMPLENIFLGRFEFEGERFCSSLPGFKYRHRGLSIAQLPKEGWFVWTQWRISQLVRTTLHLWRMTEVCSALLFATQTKGLENHIAFSIQGLACIFFLQTRWKPGWLWNIWGECRDASSWQTPARLMFGSIPATLPYHTIPYLALAYLAW